MGAPESVVRNGEEKSSSQGAGEKCDDKIVASEIEALDRLTESEASDWLNAQPTLVQSTKLASEALFLLLAQKFDKASLSKLCTDGFDAEQIWQQIDLQSHPVVSYIRRKVRNLEKSVDREFFTGLEADDEDLLESGEVNGEGEADKGIGSGSLDASENESEDVDVSEDLEAESAGDEDEEEDEDEDEEEGGRAKNGVEDDFFKISEMEKFLDRTDAEGVFGTGVEDGPPSPSRDDDDDLEADDDDEELEDGDENLNAASSEEDEEGGKGLGFGKYEDFFQPAKTKRKPKLKLLQEDNLQGVVDELSEDDEGTALALPESRLSEGEKLSAHESRQQKTEKKIKQLEKANLDPKDWTQQGEVTAKRRPKNSALEVELDFEHNARPPPVITEDFTASLEDMIRARIAEENFDDVQRKVLAPVSASRERIELDESKSQKGLGEIYEAEYMQKSGLAAAPSSTTEVLKAEAKELFKALCNRLDALSHFHFAPKPVIQDMEVHADIAALTMEEVAPLAVSEASILAPEEIFAGEDAVKGEGELDPEERKRRRAQKKRKRKGLKRSEAVDRMRKRIRPTAAAPVVQMKSTQDLKSGLSYTKSSKVFANLDRVKDGGGKPPASKNRPVERPAHASFLKL